MSLPEALNTDSDNAALIDQVKGFLRDWVLDDFDADKCLAMIRTGIASEAYGRQIALMATLLFEIGVVRDSFKEALDQ
ncbi:MAG: hypothetical protein ACJAYB_000031 [Psychromonas sp.]|jgi:hypothetical protein